MNGVTPQVEEAEKHRFNPVLPLGNICQWDSLQASPWASRSVIYDNENEKY